MTKPLVSVVVLGAVLALAGLRPARADMAAPPPPIPAAQAAALRQTCTDAMNADTTFANDIIRQVNEETALKRIHAGDKIAKDERQVILAYAAMWIAAVGFLVFLWWRQRGLEKQIAQLEQDLAAATKAATT
ncbi:MAG: hypothetical protein K8R60_09660 [Burkholderiales bacterium]|nr:hypothetical protein [Burkholderiales bacterium]